ncbi:hypothetical protein ACWF5H_17575 [Arthrobacter sp. NPDC055138]
MSDEQQRDQDLDGSPVWLADLSHFRRGDQVEAGQNDVVYYRGRVEDSAAGLGVVWIRESGCSRRRMLHTDEYFIRHIPQH